jgi:predicted Zn-ribbon and HTH transcriptional regulator
MIPDNNNNRRNTMEIARIKERRDGKFAVSIHFANGRNFTKIWALPELNKELARSNYAPIGTPKCDECGHYFLPSHGAPKRCQQCTERGGNTI